MITSINDIIFQSWGSYSKRTGDSNQFEYLRCIHSGQLPCVHKNDIGIAELKQLLPDGFILSNRYIETLIELRNNPRICHTYGRWHDRYSTQIGEIIALFSASDTPTDFGLSYAVLDDGVATINIPRKSSGCIDLPDFSILYENESSDNFHMETTHHPNPCTSIKLQSHGLNIKLTSIIPTLCISIA